MSKRAASAASPPAAKRQAVKHEAGAAKKAVPRGANAAVLAALRAAPGGLSQDSMASQCKMTMVQLAPILNALTRAGKIQLAKGIDGEILFMLASQKDIDNASKLDELSTNELHCYQTIQDKGRDGIWKRDIKHKTGLVEKEVEKILKTLQKKKLIKMEKTVLRQNGKMFFLYDVEPSAEHTGGVWYSRPRPEDPPEFDTVGVKHMADACHKFVQDANGARAAYYREHGVHMRNPSLDDIHGWVSEKSLYKEALALENIMEIMQVRISCTVPCACLRPRYLLPRYGTRWLLEFIRWMAIVMVDTCLRQQG